MTAFAASLPRVRRFRRPPKRAAYLAATYVQFLGFALRTVAWIPKEGPVMAAFLSFFALVYALCIVGTHLELSGLLSAWLNGRPVRGVSRAEWRWVVLRTVLLVWVWA